MGLGKIDLRILLFVCLNGVQLSETEIAKRLRLKPGTVRYSLKKMQREKIILGFRYRINYARLGLSTTAWVLLRLRSEKSDSMQLFDSLLEFPQVHVVSFLTGDFDLAVKVIERNVFSIDNFVRKISRQFSDIIDFAEVLLVTKNYKTHNILPKKFGCLKSFDETDFKILDSRLRFPDKGLASIASDLGLHRNTVSKRWKKLWKENILVKRTPVVNPDYYHRLNIALKALVLIEAKPEACEGIAQKLLKMDEVHELNKLLGRFSLMAIVRTANIPSFFNFLKWLVSKSSAQGAVTKTVSIIVLHSKPHKPNYLPQLLQEEILEFVEGKLVYSPT